MMKLETRPLSDSVGVEVIGFEPGRPIDGDMRRALEDIFVEHGVMLFRGAGRSVEMHVALSRCFGELEHHPVKEVWVEGHPELIDLVTKPQEAGKPVSPVYEVEGRARAGWLPWHADLFYMAQINRGGILRAVTIPTEGGKTGFIDRIRLYETLPEGIKTRIDGLSVVYTFQPDMAQQKYGMPDGLKLVASSDILDNLMARVERDFPPVVHPMVYVQAETGRKVLNVSPLHATHIQGMEGEAGDALLAEVIDHCMKPGNAYHHDWAENDLVLWDNWRTLHSAEGVPVDCTRLMQRTTIKGDYGKGQLLPH
jgi:taurine dioxygenase